MHTQSLFVFGLPHGRHLGRDSATRTSGKGCQHARHPLAGPLHPPSLLAQEPPQQHADRSAHGHFPFPGSMRPARAAASAARLQPRRPPATPFLALSTPHFGHGKPGGRARGPAPAPEWPSNLAPVVGEASVACALPGAVQVNPSTPLLLAAPASRAPRRPCSESESIDRLRRGASGPARASSRPLDPASRPAPSSTSAPLPCASSPHAASTPPLAAAPLKLAAPPPDRNAGDSPRSRVSGADAGDAPPRRSPLRPGTGIACPDSCPLPDPNPKSWGFCLPVPCTTCTRRLLALSLNCRCSPSEGGAAAASAAAAPAPPSSAAASASLPATAASPFGPAPPAASARA